MDNKYQNTVIYKISCNDANVNDLYIGHTTNLIKRINTHKHNCTSLDCRDGNKHIYQFIKSNGGWDNWAVSVVENFPCSTKYEALERERYYIETLNATLNIQLPLRTDKEYSKYYRQAHYETVIQKAHEYYKNNKDKIAEKDKKYRQKNVEKKQEYNKQYHQANKDSINIKAQQYRNEHREEIKAKAVLNRDKSNEYAKVTILCDCGISHRRDGKSKHIKSEFHKNYILSNPTITINL
jgi:hypothetical protein